MADVSETAVAKANPARYYWPAMMTSKTLIRVGISLLTAALILGVLFSALDPPAAQAAPARDALQQAPSPTPSPPGQINLPTTTPTVIGGPTATPSRTPTLTPVIIETVGNPTNLRNGPGLDFDVIATLEQGTQLPLIGRWLGNPWYLVRWEEAADDQAWVFADLVIVVIGDITTVPAVTPPPLPTIDPTQAAIEATATVLFQTPGAAETATATALYVPTGIYTQTPASIDSSGGMLPTFTPPAPYQEPGRLTPGTTEVRGGIPPAIIIISLGGVGLLTLVMGLLRRL